VTDSIRQQIITALDTRLKTIKKTASYKTDAGNNVFDWLDRDLADSELDAIVYRDKTNEISAEGFDVSGNRVRVEIEAKTKQASGTAARLREIIEDIYKAIGTDESFGGLAIESSPAGESIDIDQVDTIRGNATIAIDISYMSPKWGY
jgi:hypothetical protein